jgi:hypothetical protein
VPPGHDSNREAPAARVTSGSATAVEKVKMLPIVIRLLAACADVRPGPRRRRRQRRALRHPGTSAFPPSLLVLTRTETIRTAGT